MSRIIVLLMLITSIHLHAQNVLISGKVIVDDAVEGQDVVEQILITNETTNAKAFTSAKGIFSIKVSVGDELLFKHDFYKERKLKITQDMLSKGMVTVHLNVEVIELAEATINTLDKNLKNNIKLKYDQVDEMYKRLNLGIDPNLRFRKIDPNATSNIGSFGILNPVAWITTISGQRKREQAQYDYFKKVDKIQNLERYFTKNYFIESLNIPEHKVTEYLTYCYTVFDFEQLVKANDYDKISSILEEQAPIYLSKLNIKSIGND